MQTNKPTSLLELFRLAGHRSFQTIHFSNERKPTEIVGIVDSGCSINGQVIDKPMAVGYYLKEKEIKVFSLENREWIQ